MKTGYNQPIITYVYPIFEWSPEVPIIYNDEDKNEISNAMDQVADDIHVDSNNKVE